MQSDLKAFFTPIASNLSVGEEAYNQTRICVSMAEALSRSTNHSIYIIEFLHA